MSDAERDPHVLVSARVAEHPKIIDLPNDRARWGWIVMLGKAKLQRPPGRFASMRVLEAVLGDFRRFIPDYLKAGLIEQGDHLCDRCTASNGDIVITNLVVHDWETNQSRTTTWRRKVGVANGHGNLTGNTRGNTGETPGNEPPARAYATQSQSHSQSSLRGRGPGEGLPNIDSTVAGIWEQASGRSVLASGSWVQDKLDDVCHRHPKSEVGAAIIRARKEFDHIPEANVLMGRVRSILDPFVDGKKASADEREREERAASRRRTAATLEGIHRNGGHELEPRAGCPMCEAVTA